MVFCWAEFIHKSDLIEKTHIFLRPNSHNNSKIKIYCILTNVLFISDRIYEVKLAHDDRSDRFPKLMKLTIYVNYHIYPYPVIYKIKIICTHCFPNEVYF